MKKKWLIVIIILIVLVLLVGGFFLAIYFTKINAIKSADQMFSTIKSGDQEKIKEYIDFSSISDNNISEDESLNEMKNILFKNLNYTIEVEKIGFNKATLKVNVSNKNFKTVFSNYISKAFSLAFDESFNDMSEDEINKQLYDYVEEQYNSDSVETVSNEITLDLNKKDGKWAIDYDKDTLLNSILPGYKDIANALSYIEK